MVSLRSNISSLSVGGDSSLLDPADALRNAAAVSSVLQHIPEPESAEELLEVVELKVCDKKRYHKFATSSYTLPVRVGSEYP